ncbi:hypothetical protein C0993_007813, partial [Termitomyces sp. T159_Od127]
ASQKRPNSMANNSANPEDVEGSAGSYQIRTKLRIIADPRLDRENRELLNQLQEERIRVNLLAAQLRQAQNDQVKTAWVTRGIVNGMVEQSNAEHDLRDDALQKLQDVLHERDRLKREHEQHLQQALEERQMYEERQRNLQQDLQEQERRFQEERQTLQQAFENQNHNHAQTLQAEIDRLQAEHQQHIAESTQAREGLENRLGEMEAAQSQELQERETRYHRELNERLDQERQNLLTQSTTEVRQRLEEQDRNHQQALQSEISRLQAGHQQQLAEATQAREDMENRIRELEQVRAQDSNLIEQARLSAQAATRLEEAHETLRNVVSHDSEVIANLQAQLNPRNHRLEQLEGQIASQTSHRVTTAAQDDGHLLNTEPQAVLPATASNMNTAGPSGRRVSFNTASPEETVTPPLRIPRPYSSSNPQTPRLRLATPQPSTPRSNLQPSPLRPSSLTQQVPPSSPPPMFSMYPYSTPRRSFVGTSYASSRAASQTPPREIPDQLSSVLANLAGSVNSLREEMAETRSAFATMNNSPNTSTGFRVTSGFSRRSPYKALSTPRHTDPGRNDMMKIIREAVRIKLAIKHDKDIKTATQNRQHMASPEEVDSFDRGEIPAPTLIPFRPYWDDINCLWNESLADQVVDELLAAGHDFDGETRKDLKDYFFQRLSTLRKELKRQAPRPSETTQQAEQRAETQHQITLARNRVQMRQTTASTMLCLSYDSADGFYHSFLNPASRFVRKASTNRTVPFGIHSFNLLLRFKQKVRVLMNLTTQNRIFIMFGHGHGATHKSPSYLNTLTIIEKQQIIMVIDELERPFGHGFALPGHQSRRNAPSLGFLAISMTPIFSIHGVKINLTTWMFRKLLNCLNSKSTISVL